MTFDSTKIRIVSVLFPSLFFLSQFVTFLSRKIHLLQHQILSFIIFNRTWRKRNKSYNFFCSFLFSKYFRKLFINSRLQWLTRFLMRTFASNSSSSPSTVSSCSYSAPCLTPCFCGHSPNTNRSRTTWTASKSPSLSSTSLPIQSSIPLLLWATSAAG